MQDESTQEAVSSRTSASSAEPQEAVSSGGGNVLDLPKPASENGGGIKTMDDAKAVAEKIANPILMYDASARNRFEYEVRSQGQKYDVAHVFGPLDDERYMKWNRDLKVKGTKDDISEESREASVALWNDIIVDVENIDYPEHADWKSLIPNQEKLDALNDYLAVAIIEPEDTVKGKRSLTGAVETTQTITTEAWFNGEAVQQTHVLKLTSFELEKKYERIQAKRLKQETTRGLRRQPKIEYIPQDDKLGGLYDEMIVDVQGFRNPVATAPGSDKNIPLRFKTVVINYIFAPTLDQKNLGK